MGNNRFIGFIVTFLGAVLFSTKAIIVKKAFADIHIDALTLLTLRMIFSLPIYLLAAWFISRNKKNEELTRRQWIQIILLGLTGYYISSLLDFEGLQFVSAGLERLILFLFPTFVVLINSFYFRQKITRIQRLALVLTYAGISIAYFGELRSDISNPGFLWGSLLIFLCSITYSIYMVGSGLLIPVVGANKYTAFAMLAATGGIFLHFILKSNFQIPLLTTAGNWPYGLALAVLATVIPSFLISAGMKKIGSNNVAIISSIGPVSTIIQAHYFLDEPIRAAQVMGTLLVIAGVLLIGWRSGNIKK
jgi:drug/metabolite transporter (DMT)-like permease